MTCCDVLEGPYIFSERRVPTRRFPSTSLGGLRRRSCTGRARKIPSDRRLRMAKPNEELEYARNLQNQGRLPLPSAIAPPVLMGSLLLQHLSVPGRRAPTGIVVALLVVLLPAVLAPSSACTTPYAPAGPSSSPVPTAPAPTDTDREAVLLPHGTESQPAPRSACRTLRTEAVTVPAPAQPNRQALLPLGSDPSVSSPPDSLRGAITAAISSIGQSAPTRPALSHASQGSSGHLRSVVLRI